MANLILKGITWDHSRGYDPLIACSELYEKQTGIKIEWAKRSLTSFGDQSLTELAEKFDLLIIDHPHVGVAFATKCLFPLDELLSKKILGELKSQSAGPGFSSYYYKEKQWAIPVDAAMQCSSNRPDLLTGLSVPANWKEVFELSDQLKKKGQWIGMALCPTDSLCSFLTLTAQLGSPIKEGNDSLVKRDVGLRVLDLMRRMRDQFHPESLDWNPIQLYDHMSVENEIAYAPLAFCYTNYSREGFREKILNYNNVPTINHAVLGGAGMAVSAKTKLPNEAANYAAWIGTAEIQSSVYVTAQGQPANKLAWDNASANLLTNNFFSNTIDTLTNAYTRPRYNGWPEFQTYLGEILHDFLKNGRDPVKVLDHLQEKWTPMDANGRQ